jgi:hypothetical protein
VLNDRGYKLASTEQAFGSSGGILVTLVVMHCGTETYWQTTYPHYASGSPTSWEQVEPVIVSHTTYRKKTA